MILCTSQMDIDVYKRQSLNFREHGTWGKLSLINIFLSVIYSDVIQPFFVFLAEVYSNLLHCCKNDKHICIPVSYTHLDVYKRQVVTNTDLKHEDIVYERSNTWFAPDSGTTSGSRQTLVTGEACRRACDKVMEDRNAGKTIDDVIGKIYYGEYLAKTDPLGANVPNPVSHVAYGYATQMCILDKKTGKIEEMVAAHDVGKAVNPLSCEGQIEGGVVMSIGFALREHYPIDENCKPIDKYGSLGLFRSHEIPKIDAIVVDKPGLNVACGAIGIGEITSIPTAPAIADAYFRWNGERQYSLPLTGTPYERKC